MSLLATRRLCHGLEGGEVADVKMGKRLARKSRLASISTLPSKRHGLIVITNLDHICQMGPIGSKAAYGSLWLQALPADSIHRDASLCNSMN